MRFAFLQSSKFWIAIFFVAVIVALRLSGLGDIISFENLRAHRGSLTAWVNANVFFASAVYVLIYVGTVALSLPGAAILSLTGGFLFGAMIGTILTALAATMGATFVFLFARYFFGNRAIEILGAQYPNLVAGIRENAWSYLLVLRFVPLFPFFIVNLVAAFVGVRISTYIITTFFGILPGTTVYSLSGAGLGSVLDQGGTLSVSAVLTPTVVAALVGLAALSLAAIPLRKKFKRQNDNEVAS